MYVTLPHRLTAWRLLPTVELKRLLNGLHEPQGDALDIRHVALTVVPP